MRPLVLAALAALVACDAPARVDLSPGSLRFFGRGQSLKVHATPLGRNGKQMPERTCRWSSSDEKVAKVVGPGNDATVSSAGAGTATIRCALGGGVSAEVPVAVRVVSRVEVQPAAVVLQVLDEPAPVALEVQAFDDAGAPVAGRNAYTRCASEAVCRGDGRGQLWAVGAAIAVHVVDARTARTRPQRVSGNPMLEVEKMVRERDAAEAKKRAKVQ